MAIAPHLIQNTPEWYKYRATRGNASETAALIGCSPFYPRTPGDLFDVKTGRKTVHQTPAMARGSRLEEPARIFMEGVLGEAFSPDVCVRGRLSASLDGVTLDGKQALELKVPVKGKESHTWQYVAEHDAPPDHYWWQVQHQILCSGVDDCIFAVCEADREEKIIGSIHCIVRADPDAHKRIEEVWAWFFDYLDADERPPDAKPANDQPADGQPEVVERDDDEWRRAAETFRAAKRALDEAKAEEDRARTALLELAGDQSAKGAGVKVNRMYVQGSIDYKAAVPKGIDLEQYRKSGRWQARIDVEDK